MNKTIIIRDESQKLECNNYVDILITLDDLKKSIEQGFIIDSYFIVSNLIQRIEEGDFKIYETKNINS